MSHIESQLNIPEFINNPEITWIDKIFMKINFSKIYDIIEEIIIYGSCIIGILIGYIIFVMPELYYLYYYNDSNSIMLYNMIFGIFIALIFVIIMWSIIVFKNACMYDYLMVDYNLNIYGKLNKFSKNTILVNFIAVLFTIISINYICFVSIYLIYLIACNSELSKNKPSEIKIIIEVIVMIFYLAIYLILLTLITFSEHYPASYNNLIKLYKIYMNKLQELPLYIENPIFSKIK